MISLPTNLILIKDAVTVESIYIAALFKSIGMMGDYAYAPSVSVVDQNLIGLDSGTIKLILGNRLDTEWYTNCTYIYSDALYIEMIAVTIIKEVINVSNGCAARLDATGVVASALQLRGKLSYYRDNNITLSEETVRREVSIATSSLVNAYMVWKEMIGPSCGNRLAIPPAYQYLTRYTPATAPKPVFMDLAYSTKLTTIWELTETVGCVGYVVISDGRYQYSTLPPQVLKHATRNGWDDKLAIIETPDRKSLSKQLREVAGMVVGTIGRSK